MINFILILHIISCIGLIGLVLIQRGRGSGLVESFAGVESMFGTKTSALLTRATTVLSVVFFATCLSLAVISIKQSRSLMEGSASAPPKTAAKSQRAEEAKDISTPKEAQTKEEQPQPQAPVEEPKAGEAPKN